MMPAAGWSALLRRPVVAIVALYAVSRALLLLIGLLTVYAIDSTLHQEMGGYLSSLLCRWDCGWYLGIVERGYSAANAADQPGATNFAFFPVYPLLVRAVSAAAGLGTYGAALAVSNLCFLGALVYVYRYARLLGFDHGVGLIAVALLCFVPQSVVFSSAYTESLFLLLLAGAMYHLRREHFLLAGAFAAALSAVRANGVFFLFFALFWIVRSYGAAPFLAPWRRPELFVPVVLAPLGLFCFWAFCFWATGDAFAQSSSVSHGWGWLPGLPWENLYAHLRYDALSRFWALASLAVFACSLLLLRWRLYEEFGFCLLVFALLWSGQVPNSLLRYTIVLFPVWIALARWLQGRPMRTAITFAVFSLFNGFLMTAWTLGKLITI